MRPALASRASFVSRSGAVASSTRPSISSLDGITTPPIWAEKSIATSPETVRLYRGDGGGKGSRLRAVGPQIDVCRFQHHHCEPA